MHDKTILSSPINYLIIRAMSYNIRMAPCAEDDETENAWQFRLPKINIIFDRYAPDIIGIQEVSLFQMESLENSTLNPFYRFIGKYPCQLCY